MSVSTALVHDWLPVYSGAERVVSEIIRVAGPTDLFTLYNFLSDDDEALIGARSITTSYLDRLPFRERYYRYTFPWCGQAIESFDLSAYDLVLSSSAAFAKGVIVHPHQKHIAYIHTPIRYAWDQTFEYLRQSRLPRIVKATILAGALHRIRMWDVRSAAGADVLLANSTLVQRRIEQVYGRESVVLHPPVEVSAFAAREERDDFYLVASRLVPYKRIDLVVSAFTQMPSRRLVVSGDGPELDAIRARAGANVTFRGHIPRRELIALMEKARAFVYASYEDFGIVLAEAQAAGAPVIAFGRGGAADIVEPLGAPSPTGLLFNEQSVAAIKDAVERFEADRRLFKASACRERAELFSTDRFAARLRTIIDRTLDPSFRRAVPVA